jgi:hypothetical protein
MIAQRTMIVAASLAAILGVTLLAPVTHAEECLTAPNPAAQEGMRWYYRLDRATQRKCWYTRSIGRDQQQETGPTNAAHPTYASGIPFPRPRPPIADATSSLPAATAGSSFRAESSIPIPRPRPSTVGSALAANRGDAVALTDVASDPNPTHRANAAPQPSSFLPNTTSPSSTAAPSSAASSTDLQPSNASQPATASPMGSSNADITSSIVKQSPVAGPPDTATGDVSSATLAVSPAADSAGRLTTPEAETPIGAGAAQITPLILDPATTQSADNALGRKMDATDARRNGAAANIVPTDDSVSSARKDLVAEDTLSDREFSDPASPESGSAEPQARAPTVIPDLTRCGLVLPPVWCLLAGMEVLRARTLTLLTIHGQYISYTSLWHVCWCWSACRTMPSSDTSLGLVPMTSNNCKHPHSLVGRRLPLREFH